MISLITLILQSGEEGGGQLPDIGVRISVWFIGMFLLAVGWMILYLHLRELNDKRNSGDFEPN